ncbi:TPA: hypothetical protein DIS56_00895 [Candidatus Saccharibacteria bacterium]|nr:MAG: hypothetical protein A3F05_01840 [Candidatus Saccharibacteria bacterium RIFCSPHIGHO2_12_FULL_47_17]HCM51680.1 hypothetical protein [Candidatus Saccharibacteria bacterium]
MVQWISHSRHRFFLSFLGLIAGFFFAGLWLSGQGPDAGMATIFFGPIFAIPIILLILLAEERSFKRSVSQETVSRRFWIILFSALATLLFIFWLIWLF